MPATPCALSWRRVWRCAAAPAPTKRRGCQAKLPWTRKATIYVSQTHTFSGKIITSTNMEIPNQSPGFNATINETSASASAYNGPRLILGTLAISGSSSKDLPALLCHLSKSPIPITAIDTAPFYPTHRPGYVESLLGSALQTSRLSYEVYTKTMLSTKDGCSAGKGDLHFKRVRESVQSSLGRLKIPKVKTLLAARPDEEAAVAEIAGVFNAIVKEGLCEQWGLCDFDFRLLSDITKTADKRGCVPPKVYQGRYGALHRRRAERLIDFLKERNMIFLARSTPKSQFSVNIFDIPEVRETIQVLKAIEDMHSLTPRAVSLRWLAHHSKLRPEDGIILESATFEELQSDVEEIHKGPLSNDVLNELDRAWHAEEDNKPNGR